MFWLMTVLSSINSVERRDKAKVGRKVRARIGAKSISTENPRKRAVSLAPPRASRSRASQGQGLRKLPKKRKKIRRLI